MMACLIEYSKLIMEALDNQIVDLEWAQRELTEVRRAIAGKKEGLSIIEFPRPLGVNDTELEPV